MLKDAQAVMFDFDGLILDTEWAIYETWKALFEKEGQKLTIPIYAQCIGSDFDTWSPQTHLEELTGKSFDWDTINAKRQQRINSELKNEDPLPGVNECIQFLKEKKVGLAVVSSSSFQWVNGWLEKLNLREHFDVVVTRNDVKRIKPAPDLYLKGAQQLQVVPENCVVLEDSLNGIKAAHAAGCKSVAVPSRLTEHYSFELANRRVSSLLDLVV